MHISEDLWHLFRKAYLVLEHSENTLIVSPRKPDRDSIASGGALSRFINLLWPEKRRLVYCPDEMPTLEDDPLMALLPIEEFTDVPPQCWPNCIAVLDYGSFDKACLAQRVFKNNPWIISIDHHEHSAYDLPEHSIDINEPEVCSTTALLFHFFKCSGVPYNFPRRHLLMDQDIPITPEMASYLAVGIYGDTEGFTNAKTNAHAHAIYAECVRLGASDREIREVARRRLNLRILRKVGQTYEAIIRNAELRLKMSWVAFDWKEVMAWGGRQNIMEYVLPRMAELKEIDLGIIFVQEPDGQWQVSFRSTFAERIPAHKIAEELKHISGEGGGDQSRAGALWREEPETALKIIRRKLRRLQRTQNGL